MCILLPLTSAVLLLSYNSTFQTFVAQSAASWLSAKLKTKLNIGRLKIVDFHQLELEGLLLEDREQDTILQVGHMLVDMKNYRDFNIINNSLTIRLLKLSNGQIFLHKDRKGVSSLKFVIDYFSSGEKNSNNSRPFTLFIRQIDLRDFRFRLENEVHEKILKPGILNTNDLDIKNINFQVLNFFNQDDSVQASIKHLSFIEKCGFSLKHLETKAVIGAHKMVFNHLLVETPFSRLANHYEMHFQSIDSLDDFEKAVYMRANLHRARLSSKDIAHFSSYLKNIDIMAVLSGRASGWVNNLQIKDFDLQSLDHTHIKGNLLLKGLPNLPTTYMDLNLEKLQTSATDVKALFTKIGLPRSIEDIPIYTYPLDITTYTGNFKGYLNDFTSTGTITSALGTVVSSIHLNTKGALLVYNGTILTSSFNLGKMLQEPDLGSLSCSAKLNGQGFNKMEGIDSFSTVIQHLDFGGHRYNNLSLNGKRIKKLLEGTILILDTNLKLNLAGSVDLGHPVPVFRLSADIRHADLRNLGLLSDSISIKTRLDINAEGSNLSNLQGSALISDTRVSVNQISRNLDSIRVSTEKEGVVRTLNLTSCMFDASVKGVYNFETFPSDLKRIFVHYAPSYPWGKIVSTRSQNFEFSLNVNDAESLLGLFAPGFSLNGPFSTQGSFNTKTGQFRATGSMHEFAMGNIEVTGLTFDGSNEDMKAMNLNISVDSVRLEEKMLARQINISNHLLNDSLMFNLKVSDVNAPNHLDLNGRVAFHKISTTLDILPSELILNHQPWRIANSFKVAFQKALIRIKDLKIERGNESLSIDGLLSDKPEDTLMASFKEFNISTINQILKQYNIQLQGNLNGKALLSGILDKLSFSSDLNIDSLAVNKIELGKMHMVNKWNGDTRALDFDGNVHHKNMDVMQLQGSMGLSEQNNAINASLLLDRADLADFQPLLSGLLSDLKGHISSDLKVSGVRTDPIINGSIKLDNAEFTIDYLKTHYKMNDHLKFEDGYIDFSKLMLTDPFYKPSVKDQHVAFLDGEVDLSHLSEPYIDASIQAQNFLCLNTTAKDNDTYYGTAFSTGDFNFKGPLETMNIDIKAITNKNTVFNVPLNKPTTVGKHDFVTFVKIPDSIASAKKRKNIHKGVTLNFDLGITTDATAELIFDKDIGDVIKGAGTSDMNIQISPQGDFLMYGTYEIDHGDYLFTSQNVLNKHFTVDKGGSIRFTGDPMTAQLNLQADYQARTSVKNLYEAANVQPTNQSALDQSVLVGCKIKLEGNLSNPTFDFDLNFPSDPNIEYDLQTFLRSKEVVTTQSMLFLASNQFNGKLTPSNGVAIATSTSVQFLSNQLSNLLNNFSTHFDLNFRSLSDVGINYRFLNDRLVFTGNLASTDTASNIAYNPLALANSKRLAGNLELAYTLNKARSITLRVYGKAIPQDILPKDYPTTVYSPGIGIVYQKDFSSLRSIFRRQKSASALLLSDTTNKVKHRHLAADSLQKVDSLLLPEPIKHKKDNTENKQLILNDKTDRIQDNTPSLQYQHPKPTSDSVRSSIQIIRRRN